MVVSFVCSIMMFTTFLMSWNGQFLHYKTSLFKKTVQVKNEQKIAIIFSLEWKVEQVSRDLYIMELRIYDAVSTMPQAEFVSITGACSVCPFIMI